MWLSNARKALNKTFSILVIFCLACFGCSKEEKEINVYAASSLTEAISAVIKNYEEIHEVKDRNDTIYNDMIQRTHINLN